ncbi:MAG TPA: glycoside hydrolase family 97 protein [Prolixibacteraceae bacterium]|nr:glycoside hydrolase family 97 protein [Prolixibacteraceae bacterium]
MKPKFPSTILLLFFALAFSNVCDAKLYELKSPDETIVLTIETGEKTNWSVSHSGQVILSPSTVSLSLENGEVLGERANVISGKREAVDETFSANLYKKAIVHNAYNQLVLICKGDYSMVFRAYNDGVAYRFETRRKGELIVKYEEANFNFEADYPAFIPYMWDYRGGKKFNHSFEALYREGPISEFAPDSLAFLPVLVDVGNGKKAVILEADLDDYPGMYLNLNETQKGFKSEFAPYPLETEMGGYQNMNEIPVKRADYIAKTNGTRTFPWRVVVISVHDKELLDNDMVQKLSPPCRIDDPSWIKPGLVAWDWWNDWNVSHVDFRAGYNTPTYKYYIDFAAENKIPYIVIDWGWSSKTDLFELTTPELDIPEIIRYGQQKEVGVVLWATWYAVKTQIDTVFAHYSRMGARGFKIDFVDRDDQLSVASLYDIAQKAAEYKMIVDYHGVFKPTGLHRAYPNVVGYEGVKGLENYKWADEDQPRYCVTIPFVRMLAGPMDYTPGAMRNATRETFFANNSMPMSKGTRCAQLAMYVLYEAPFQMLSDNPTIYRKEQECTDFIAKVPTVFDETVALDGELGEFAAIARRKGDTWYVGALTNWTPRERILDFSFLSEGDYEAVLFSDGRNADRDATDYQRRVVRVKKGDRLAIKMAHGGGWAARLEKIK